MAVRMLGCWLVVMVLTNALVGGLAVAEAGKPQLCVGNYQSEDEAKAQLARFKETYSNLSEWQERARTIREGILRGTGLWPLPRRCSLKPIIHSQRQYDGYTVENVAIESLPGVFVTGSLYRPTRTSGPFPAVLCPHGHWGNASDYGRFRPDMQKRCGTMARMGAIVLSYDMVGYGDWKNAGWEHRRPDALKIQLWNSIRLVDFLTSRADVDPTRIAVSIPTVMVSAHFFGGCVCESGMPIHKRSTHETNNTEIAALAAPRPQLIISDGADWTKNVPEVEFPHIQSVYRLYGAQDNVDYLHLPDEKHDYGWSKRIGCTPG